MNSEGISQEFREIQAEAQDSDPNIRGMAAIEFGSFAGEHPEYKDRIVSILENMLNDPDADVRKSAQTSLAQLQGKEIFVPGQQVIGFGYVPEEYRQPEVDQKQMILSCVCCIAMIIALSLMFIYLF